MPTPAPCHSGMTFQSTPVITDGRTDRNQQQGDTARRFNPRPSSLTGEQSLNPDLLIPEKFQSTPVIADGRTVDNTRFKAYDGVSIHARHR